MVQLIPGKPVLVNPILLSKIEAEAMCMQNKPPALCKKLCQIVFSQKELASVDGIRRLDPVKVATIKGKYDNVF